MVLIIKNKFNDKSIKDDYCFYCHKSIQIKDDDQKDQIFFIITSNKGKAYIINYINILNLEQTNNKQHSVCNFIELSENPHSMCIFNIITFQNKFILVSSDKLISIWQSLDFQFEYDIKTINSKPKRLLFSNFSNKHLFLENEGNCLLQYNFKKEINGIQIASRKSYNLVKERQTITKIFQSNFNENIFALVQSMTRRLVRVCLYITFSLILN